MRPSFGDDQIFGVNLIIAHWMKNCVDVYFQCTFFKAYWTTILFIIFLFLKPPIRVQERFFQRSGLKPEGFSGFSYGDRRVTGAQVRKGLSGDDGFCICPTCPTGHHPGKSIEQCVGHESGGQSFFNDGLTDPRDILDGGIMSPQQIGFT